MRERGMNFNAEMVRAILNGSKTQTRRVMKPQPTPDDYICPYDGPRGGHIWPSKNHQYGLHVELMMQNGEGHWDGLASQACPFGEVGDRIWVRETYRVMGCATDVARLMYKASERNSFTESTRTVPVGTCTKQPSQNWTPSIHMPRWASRILLEITAVRVERLQAITLGDICKEIGCGLYDFRPATYGFQVWEDLWKSIYGEKSWQANSWVWVIEFKRVGDAV